ncbi:MAG: hypothetical protein JWQ49_929 [Edaphobacter sp.]|nr:hypothetical protein [Edaphobacter sp.]
MLKAFRRVAVMSIMVFRAGRRSFAASTLVLIELGRRFRVRHKAPPESTAIEIAIFALFGLLLAFTFSGAVARYDAHRRLVVEETNAIGTAYLRLDLLPPAAQPPLRQLFRDYTDSRLHLYDAVSEEGFPCYRASTARDMAAVCRRRHCTWSKRMIGSITKALIGFRVIAVERR